MVYFLQVLSRVDHDSLTTDRGSLHCSNQNRRAELTSTNHCAELHFRPSPFNSVTCGPQLDRDEHVLAGTAAALSQLVRSGHYHARFRRKGLRYTVCVVLLRVQGLRSHVSCFIPHRTFELVLSDNLATSSSLDDAI